MRERQEGQGPAELVVGRVDDEEHGREVVELAELWGVAV